MGANARGVVDFGRVFAFIIIAGSLGASAWAVRPRDADPSIEKRIASPRGHRTGVAVQGGPACAGDCDDANASVWSAPGETPGVAIGPGSVLTRNTPSTGAMPAAMRYDVLRSGDPRDFTAAATCVASQLSALTGSDAAQPPVGTLFFYQVRATDACPDGAGSLGSRSDGTPRVGRACP